MSIKHLFIREHDGSACKGGFCAKDARCRDRSCEGHPLGYEAGFLPLQNADGGATVDTGEIEMYEPSSWEVIRGLFVWMTVGLAAFVAAILLYRADVVAWLWPRLIVALS